MSLKLKVLLAMAAMVALMISLSYHVLQGVVLPSFYELERAEAIRNVARAESALDAEITALARTAADYAKWDDTYAFIAGDLPSYPDMMIDETLETLNVNVTYFYDLDGRIVWSAGYDWESGEHFSLTELDPTASAAAQALLAHGSPTDAVQGVVMTPRGPLLFASSAILDTARQAPPRGTALFGRLLKDSSIQALRERVEVELEMLPVTSALPAALQDTVEQLAAGDGPVFAESRSAIDTYSVHPDIHGQPAILVHLSSPRTAVTLGTNTVKLALAALLAIGIADMLLMWFLIRRLVLRPVSELRDNVLRVAGTGNLATRMPENRGDELGVLAREYNRMLAWLDRSRDALQASEATSRAIVETAVDGILTIDESGSIASFNPAAERIFGYAAHEVLGQPVGMLIARPVGSTDDGPLATGPGIDERLFGIGRQVTGRRKDGAEFPMDLSVGQALVRGQEVSIAVVRDTSGRQQMLHALMAAKETAETANRLKSQFLANMSHELRTPLNAVIGFAELIEQEIHGYLGDAKYREYAAHIHAGGRHLLRLINEVLDLSKIEAGQMAVAEAVFDLRGLIGEAMRLLAARAETAGVTLHASIAPELQACCGDEVRLKQVMLNLLSNALKFTPAGGTVTIAAGLGGSGELVITVTDTGIGIAQEDMAKLFKPFSQVADAYTRTTEGTGLGLVIAKQLVELHGGTLTLDSELGVGTTIRIVLPPDRVVGHQGQKSVLVIDDDAQIRRMLRRAFERSGYRVREADHGQAGQAMLEESSPDLVICDLVMPGTSGTEIIRRAATERPELRIIAITGKGKDPEQALAEVVRLGAHHAHKKPFSLRDLLESASTLLEDRVRTQRNCA